MTVLFLSSNSSWPGPAELARQQAHALHTHGADFGIEVQFALAGHKHAHMPHFLRGRAEELGLPILEGLELRRHFHLPSLLRDAAILSDRMDAMEIDLLHCHQAGDHFIAALTRSSGTRRVPIVRSYWEREAPDSMPRTQYAFDRCDLVLCPFESQLRTLIEAIRMDRASFQVQAAPLAPGFVPPTETQRREARHRLLEEFRLEEDSLLLGMTARIQTRRRWELVWETLAAVHARAPLVKLCLLGRPDEGVFDEVCREPLEALGLEEHVCFLGYREGRAYLEALHAFDFFFFLVPGSDISCRALREARATGLAAVCPQTFPFDELISDGVDGFLAEQDAFGMADPLLRLADDAGLRERLGAAASTRTLAVVDPREQARSLAEHYASLFGSSK